MAPAYRAQLAAFCSSIGRWGRATIASLALAVLALGPAQPALAQPAVPADGGSTLFQNVRVFDGKNARLSAPSSVLIRGNTIERISTGAIAPEADTRVIDGGGRVLMPGLIDNHWHATLVRLSPIQLMTNDVSYSNF